MINIKTNECEYTINPSQIVYFNLIKQCNAKYITIQLTNGKEITINHLNQEVIMEIWENINNAVNSTHCNKGIKHTHIDISSNKY